MVSLFSHVLFWSWKLHSVLISLGQVMQVDIQICNEVRERHILEKMTQI